MDVKKPMLSISNTYIKSTPTSKGAENISLQSIGSKIYSVFEKYYKVVISHEKDFQNIFEVSKF